MSFYNFWLDVLCDCMRCHHQQSFPFVKQQCVSCVLNKQRGACLPAPRGGDVSVFHSVLLSN